MGTDQVSADHPDKRFPASVYRVGEDADPGFSLANERTFLAWIRTALAVLAAGVTVNNVKLLIPTGAQLVIGTVLVLGGLFCVVQAWLGWVGSERALRLGSSLPRNPSMLVLTALLLLVVTVYLVAVFLD